MDIPGWACLSPGFTNPTEFRHAPNQSNVCLPSRRFHRPKASLLCISPDRLSSMLPHSSTRLERQCAQACTCAADRGRTCPFVHARSSERSCGTERVRFCTQRSTACANTDTNLPFPALTCPFLHTRPRDVCRNGHVMSKISSKLSVFAHGQ